MASVKKTWDMIRPLTEQELFEALMNDSDDENYRELPLDKAFSDVSETEDGVEVCTEEPEEIDVINNASQSTSESSDSEIEDEPAQLNWSYIAPKSGKRKVTEFVRKEKCLTEQSKNVSSILDCFRLFISDAIVDLIVKYTNKHGREFVDAYNEQQQNAGEPNRMTWAEVDATEIFGFIAILVLTGRFREAKENPHSLWSVTNKSLNRPIYQAIMSRNRFLSILRHIRFDDLSTRPERKQNDKLAPIREFADVFAHNCRDSYCPSAWGTIDEQLVSFRGRCPFRVYIPSKPGKYGIKIWALCDAETFFCCNFEIYLGKIGEVSEKNQGPRVVKTLAQHWHGSGRNITTDNFFTDITLAEELLSNKITLVGTMRKSRKDIPKQLLDVKKRALFSSDFLFTNTMTLVSYITKPRKFVVLLSSLHHQHEISTEENKFKPEIILTYNKTKSGVDILDKLVREYSCKRSTRRWPLRLFYNFIDIACYNSFVIWILKNPEWKSDSSIKFRRRLFLEQLGLELSNAQLSRRRDQIENDGRGFSNEVCTAIRATGVTISKRQENSVIGTKRGRCYACRGRDNKYSNKCEVCKRFVCPTHSKTTHTVKITKCSTCKIDEDGEP